MALHTKISLFQIKLKSIGTTNILIYIVNNPNIYYCSTQIPRKILPKKKKSLGRCSPVGRGKMKLVLLVVWLMVIQEANDLGILG